MATLSCLAFLTAMFRCLQSVVYEAARSIFNLHWRNHATTSSLIKCTGCAQLIGSISWSPCWSTVVFKILLRHICLRRYACLHLVADGRRIRTSVEADILLIPWYRLVAYLMAIVCFRLPCREHMEQSAVNSAFSIVSASLKRQL